MGSPELSNAKNPDIEDIKLLGNPWPTEKRLTTTITKHSMELFLEINNRSMTSTTLRAHSMRTPGTFNHGGDVARNT